MMRRITSILALCFSLGAAGCSRFDLQTTSSGQTYRIDRRSGEVALVTQTGVAPIPTISPDSVNPFIAIATNRARYWPQDSLPNIGVKEAALITRCRGGYLHYRLELTPVPPRYSATQYQPFTLRFEDDAGFALAEVPILRANLSRLVDRSGKATGLQVTSRVPLSADDCRELRSWSLLWFF